MLQTVPQGDVVPLHRLSAHHRNIGRALPDVRPFRGQCLQRLQALEPEQDSDVYHDLSTLMLRGWADTRLLHLARSKTLLIRYFRGNAELLSNLDHIW